ncbi:MAG: hypothetical protein ACI9WU_004395, partial [Myxococcota bacterium]
LANLRFHQTFNSILQSHVAHDTALAFEEFRPRTLMHPNVTFA